MPLSSFVGRERELTEITRLLADNRLLTLTGPGGAGKTRLALEAAGGLVEAYEDGVWMIELTPLADPSLVPQAVASAWGVREQPGRPLISTLSDYLSTRRLLLILDNCEHLIDACAALAETLLQCCAELRILCTTREPLNITGEMAWPVPSLTLPDLQQLPDSENLRAYEAVRLFSERASAVTPTFALSSTNAPAVAQICCQLDGIPLALELAAARTKVLSVQEIAARLGDSLRLLVEGGRTTVPRHRTLQATIDWSHDLLPAKERVLFRRLAAFSGGFTLTAAEAVAAGGTIRPDEVLALLSHLVDKSLVATRPNDGETRYRLLDTIRQYGRDRLHRSGEEADVTRRHGEFFVRFAETAESELTGPGQPRWLMRVEADHDNLRAALAWALADRDGDAELGARLAGALWVFWFTRGHPSEGRRWLESAAGLGESVPGHLRAKALNGAGMLAMFQEQYDDAKSLVDEGLAIYRRLGDQQGVAFSLVTLGSAAIVGQRTDIAVAELLAEALTLKPHLTDRRILGNMLDLEGAIAFVTGDAVRAMTLWHESLVLSRDIGDPYGEAFSLSNLGLLATVHADDERATVLLEDGLRLGLELDYKLIVQYCLMGLGKIGASRGQLRRAARLWGAAESMSEAYGTHLTRAGRSMIGYDKDLAIVRSQLGDPAWAIAWAEGRAMRQELAGAYALERGTDDDAAPGPYPGGLSAREAEILSLVSDGMTNAEVARKLFLSSRTVDWHLSSIYTKLGVHSRTEAVRFAVDHGLV